MLTNIINYWRSETFYSSEKVFKLAIVITPYVEGSNNNNNNSVISRNNRGMSQNIDTNSTNGRGSESPGRRGGSPTL